jgi:heme A synthase
VTSLSIAAAVAILTFGSGFLGLYLQKLLPRTHLSGGSKDMILAVIGLLTLLLALVLGTLVGNTYAFFAMQKSELETMASRALLVDQALAEYGPEAKPARSLMKQALTQSYDLFWRGADADPAQLKVEVALNRWRPVAYALSALGLCQTKRSRCLAMLESGHEQPVPIFQQLARSDPSGRNDVRAVPAVAAQR